MSRKTAYILLGFSIAAELVGSTYITYSQGYTVPIPSMISIIAYASSFFVFSKVLTKINLSIAYATWSAVGTAVAALISVALFRQPLSPAGVVGIIMIIVGVILLNLRGTPDDGGTEAEK